MTALQKIIKYCAMAFGIFLAVGIIVSALSVIGLFNGLSSSDGVLDEVTVYTVTQDITELEIDIDAFDFTLTTGESFSVKSNLKYISVDVKNGCLEIKQTKHFNTTNGESVLEICIPNGFVFDKADISTSAANFDVDSLSVDKLHLDLGAGSVEIDELNVNSKVEIDGGAGKIVIKGGTINNIDLDMGVGTLDLTGELTGNGEIDCGVGETEITLIGSQDNYCIDVDKGVGNVTVDGHSMSDGAVYGTGGNRLSVDGGIGSIKVDFN